MKNKRILIGAIVSAGIMALAGSAFTASNTMPADIVKGYGEQQVTGVELQSVTYNLDVNKTNIVSVDLALVGDTTTLDIQWAFNDADPVTCAGGVFDDGEPGLTDYNCAVAGTFAVHDLERFVLYADGLA